MSISKNKATLIRTKLEAGMATKSDKEWLKKYELKIKKK